MIFVRLQCAVQCEAEPHGSAALIRRKRTRKVRREAFSGHALYPSTASMSISSLDSAEGTNAFTPRISAAPVRISLAPSLS